VTTARRGVLLALALLLALAPGAAAHVSVNPSELPTGSFGKLTFRVPNERDDADTVRIELAFPDEPIENVSIQPVEGWDYAIDREGDAVTQITWSGGRIGLGEFEEFSISIGPVPDVETLEFRALQTYSSGEVVRWIDSVDDGGEEPEHPAPTVTVTAGDAGDHDADAGADDAGAATEDEPATGGEGEDGTDPIAFIALIVAGAALVGAVTALIFGPRRVPA
jgi:uncharacterized protein